MTVQNHRACARAVLEHVQDLEQVSKDCNSLFYIINAQVFKELFFFENLILVQIEC